jgi:hypothetical protein
MRAMTGRLMAPLRARHARAAPPQPIARFASLSRMRRCTYSLFLTDGQQPPLCGAGHWREMADVREIETDERLFLAAPSGPGSYAV